MSPVPRLVDGLVRMAPAGPGIGVLLPRHAVGAEGADVLQWASSTTSGADEIVTESFVGSLHTSVRHEVSDDSWRFRVSIANDSQAPVSLSEVLLDLQPGDGRVWLWAAVTSGLLVLVTAESELWAFTLRQGSLRREGDAVTWLDPGTEVAPGGRVVLDLSGRRCGGWDEIASMLPSWLPPLAVRDNEPVTISLPDAGVVADCVIGDTPEGTELHGSGAQHARLLGSFGEVALDLAFAPALEQAAAAGARQVARLVREVPGAVHQVSGTGPQSRARDLDRTGRRLVLLQSARSHVAADVVRGWLLDGVTDLLQSGGTPGPFALAALAGEAQRRDDPQALEVLLDALPELDSEPGQVLAVTRAWAVLWGLGRDPEPARQALAWLLSQPGTSRLESIERGLVLGRDGAVVDLLGVLGGGLPGGLLPEPEAWQQAYAVALTSLVGDETAEASRLVQAAQTMTHRLVAQHPEDADVLAWLLLGER